MYLQTGEGTAYTDGGIINYVLVSGSEEMIVTPMISQTYSFCPITASLTGAA